MTPGEPPAVHWDSAPLDSHSVAVTTVTADAGQVASAEAPRGQGKRRIGTSALAAALVTVIASATAWLISEPASLGVFAAIVQSPTPGGPPSIAGPPPASGPGAPALTEAIQLKGSTDSAKPFQTVPLSGTYLGGADTFLEVQRWEGGKWVTSPLPTKTDESGQFTAYVELGQPGRYRIRVLDPGTGVKSEPSELVIKG